MVNQFIHMEEESFMRESTNRNRIRLTAYFFTAFFVAAALFAAPVIAGDSATLEVSNREPRTGEVPYHPAEGESTTVNPPGFVWLPEAEAETYILQCSSTPDFSVIEYERADIANNVHCPPRVFPPGTWYWRYTFVTPGGNQAGWSAVRRFQIPADAAVFPQPALSNLIYRLPEGHPRLFLRPETVKEFRERMEQNFPDLWKQFLDNAERQLEDPVTFDEPPPYPDGKRGVEQENISLWRKNRVYVVNAVEHAANLAFAYRLTGDSRYGEKAREWILAVTAWPPDGTTSHQYNDECGMPILSRIPRAYTWAYEALSEDDRRQVIQTMRARGAEVYAHLHDKRHHTVRPYDSHSNRAWHFLGEAAIAFIGDIPEARTWLQYAMDIFFNVYPVWNGEDGGWHEGVAYWRSYIERITWWLDILHAAFDIDGFQKPFFKHCGDFPLYVLPPGTTFGGFGDSADTSQPADFAPLMNYLAGRARNPYWKWYAVKAGPAAVGKEKPTYEDLLRAENASIPAREPLDIPQSKIFPGTGIASLHSNLSRPDKDVHVLFKSSPFGRQSHGFNAQNSFLLWAFGKPLLIWSGHRDWHGSEHHTQWMWETFADNCITVNGEGQIRHSPEARGKIVQEYLHPRVDYVLGDASEAYGGRLIRFHRHVFFLKPDLVLLVDELEAPEPAKFQFHLHALEPFKIKAQYEIEAQNGPAAARIAFVTPSNLAVTQTQGFTPPPVGYEQEQWHLLAETPDPVAQTRFLTVINTHQTYHQVQAQYDRGLKEDRELYAFKVDYHTVMVIFNPSGKFYKYGNVETDAGLVLMDTDLRDEDAALFFAVDAARVILSGKTYHDSSQRGLFAIQWNQIQPLPKTEETGEATNDAR